MLIVEDQPTLADDIADGLRDQGMAADVAYDGASGLDKKLMNHYDVVIVDRDLPRIHAQNRSIWPSPSTNRTGRPAARNLRSAWAVTDEFDHSLRWPWR